MPDKALYSHQQVVCFVSLVDSMEEQHFSCVSEFSMVQLLSKR